MSRQLGTMPVLPGERPGDGFAQGELPTSQRERAEVLRSDALARESSTLVDHVSKENVRPGGRYAGRSLEDGQVALRSSQYPPRAEQRFGLAEQMDEPPLGYDINAVVPVGGPSPVVMPTGRRGPPTLTAVRPSAAELDAMAPTTFCDAENPNHMLEQLYFWARRRGLRPVPWDPVWFDTPERIEAELNRRRNALLVEAPGEGMEPSLASVSATDPVVVETVL
jgi:hypothetical protein